MACIGCLKNTRDDVTAAEDVVVMPPSQRRISSNIPVLFRTLANCCWNQTRDCQNEAVIRQVPEFDVDSEIVDLLRARDCSFRSLHVQAECPVDQAVSVLAEALVNDSHAKTRAHAAETLQKLGPEAVALARKELHKAEQDSSISVRTAARLALKTHYAPAEEKAWEVSDTMSTMASHQDSLPPQLEFQMSLEMKNNDDKWGIDMYHIDGKFLKVIKVNTGFIREWNQTRMPAEIVKEGDIIVEINGISADSKRMVESMKTCRSIDIRVQRHS